MSQRWPDVENVEFFRLVRLGFTRNQIAERLTALFDREFTPSQIGGKARRVGVVMAKRARAARRPRLVIAPARNSVSYEPVPFLARKATQCSYPLWADDQRTGDVCGARKRLEVPYCEAHLARCWSGWRLA